MARESAKTRKTRNMAMVALVVVIAVAAVVVVGSLQGWFGGTGEMTASDKTGTVNVIRSDISYSLDDGAEVREGDVVETSSGSSIAVGYKNGGSVYVDSDTEASFGPAGDSVDGDAQDGMPASDPGTGNSTGARQLGIDRGQIVVHTPVATTVSAGGNEIALESGVCVIAYQTSSLNVGVLSGNVTVNGQKVELGSTALAMDGTFEVTELKATSFDDYMLGVLQTLASSEQLCFASDELKQVADDRAEQKRQAQQSDISSAAGDGDLTCTLEIRCDTVLSNMGNLKPGLDAYVPSDGVILSTTAVSFSDGESAYDVLSRACDAAAIPLEASWNPLYDAYYVEGINNLYEMDCGSGSGWTYKVNGWVPNYGLSGYKLQDGDAVQLLYTCDYGNDI